MITVAERNEVFDDASFRIASRIHKAVTGVAEVSRFVLSSHSQFSRVLKWATGSSDGHHCRFQPER